MRNVTHIRRFRETDFGKLDSRFDPLSTSENETILMASSGISYTVLVENSILGIIGGNILWPGVCQVWAFTSDRIRGNGLVYTKIVDNLLTFIAYQYGIRRYHCIVNSEIHENVRWLYLLKFEYEFTMYRASPNEADIYGYVRWENPNNVFRSRQAQNRLQKFMG